MTVVLPVGRGLARHLVPRSNQLLTRLTSTNPLLRVSYSNAGDTDSLESCRTILATKAVVCAFRNYATSATSKVAGRPKAHTSRTTGKKTTTKNTKSASTNKKATKKVASKLEPKARTKPKPKARAVKKPLSSRAINRERIARNKDLKAKALLPDLQKLPATAWKVYFTEQMKTTTGGGLPEANARLKEAAQDFKHLSLEERERLNHTANSNKAKNEADYKKWVLQYTPAQIKEANNARNTLNKERKVKDGKKKSAIHLIKDDRLVKQPVNAYTYFFQERFASGDFNHMTVPEAAKLAGREWKALNASEKKRYTDQSEADRNRYIEEVRTVYGKEPNVKKSKKAT